MATEITEGTVLTRIESLQRRYARALDGRDMQGWLATFSTRGSYELTSQENRRLGLPVGMMLDDCHARLRDRVKNVDQVWNHAVEHYQPRHLIALLSCEQADEGYRAITNFSVFHTNSEGKSNLLVVGQYHDHVVEEDGELRFLSKAAVMDTAVPPRYIIYPI